MPRLLLGNYRGWSRTDERVLNFARGNGDEQVDDLLVTYLGKTYYLAFVAFEIVAPLTLLMLVAIVIGS